MWIIIAGLIVLGAILLVIEAFVPGLVVGICGALALLAAGVLGYVHYGPEGASVILLILLVGGIGFLAWWFTYAPRSFFARRWALTESVPDGPDPESHSSLLNATGEAVTPLRPAGVATLGGRRTDVVTQGEMVDAGCAVQVIAVEGRRVVVRAMAV